MAFISREGSKATEAVLFAFERCSAGLRHLTAVPIRANERVIGILTLGFNEENEHHASHSL